MENGVGMSRDFLDELAFQAQDFPAALAEGARVTLVSGALTAPLLQDRVVPVLERVEGLDVDVVTCTNLLFGEVVTVSGLLNYKSFLAELKPRRRRRRHAGRPGGAPAGLGQLRGSVLGQPPAAR